MASLKFFVTSLLHHAPPRVISVLVLFVIFACSLIFIVNLVDLHKISFADSVVFLIAIVPFCCVRFPVYDHGVVDCGQTFLVLPKTF